MWILRNARITNRRTTTSLGQHVLLRIDGHRMGVISIDEQFEFDDVSIFGDREE